MTAEALIETRGVTRRFGGFTALKDVSVGIRPGVLTSIMSVNRVFNHFGHRFVWDHATFAEYLAQIGFVDIVRAEFGDALVDDLTVYPEYAVIFRADPRAPRKQETYRYDEDGFGSPSTSGTRDPQLPPVDLAAVDMAKVAGLVAGAATSLGLSEIDTIYAIIRSTETGPEVSVHANNELGESGHLSANPDGTFRAVYPFDPGS